MTDFGLSVDRASLDRAVLESSKNFLENLLRKKRGPAAAVAGRLAGRAILSSPEAASLLTGALRHELGVPSPDKAVQAVADAVAGSVVTEVLPPFVSQGRISAGMRVKVLREDLSDLGPLMDELRFYSEGKNADWVDWLRWLLSSGTTIAVAGFGFRPGPSPASRTGFGTMAKGNGWSVPGESSGVPGDNWLSRALDGVGPEIAAAVAAEVFGA